MTTNYHGHGIIHAAFYHVTTQTELPITAVIDTLFAW